MVKAIELSEVGEPSPTARKICSTIQDERKRAKVHEFTVGPGFLFLLRDVSLKAQSRFCESLQTISLDQFLSGYRGPGRRKLADDIELSRCSATTIATKAWLAMCRYKEDQVIHVQGTNSTNNNLISQLLTEQLVHISSNAPSHVQRVHTDIIKAQIFMNALGSTSKISGEVTKHFGMFHEYQFNEVGAILGAKFYEFHFDAIRVSNAPIGESNFHIFHAMCAAAATAPELQRTKLLTDASKYSLLAAGDSAAKASGVGETTFQLITKCMKALGLKKRFQAQLFATLGGLVHLGNVEFESDGKNKQAAAFVRNMEVLKLAADLLGLQAEALQTLLTCKTVLVQDMAYTDFLSPIKAREMRDMLISSIYSSTFAYVVDLINRQLSREITLEHFIGILDMGGIQEASSDSAHILSRNYAVERVHQLYMNQEEKRYTGLASDLGLPSVEIPSENPAQLMDGICSVLMTGLKSSGPLSPVGTSPHSSGPSSIELGQTILSQFGKHPNFTSLGTDNASSFAIKHTLGIFNYSTALCIQQMATTINPEFVTVFRNDSTSPFLQQAYGEARIATYTSTKRTKRIVGARPLRRAATNRKARKKGAATASKSSSPMEAASSPPPESASPLSDKDGFEDEAEVPLNKISNTTIGQHKSAIDALVDSIRSCHHWSISSIVGKGFTNEVAGTMSLQQLVTMQQNAPQIWTEPSSQFFAHYIHLQGPETEEKSPSESMSDPNNFFNSIALLGVTLTKLANDCVAIKQEDWLKMEGMSALNDHRFETSVELGAPPTFASVTEKASRDKIGGHDDRSSVAGTLDMELEDFAECSGLSVTEAHAKSTAAAAAQQLKPKVKLTKTRRRWMAATTFLTWWVPTPLLVRLGGTDMVRADIQQAWREKVALCIIIAFLSGLMIFFITGFSALLCPEINMYSEEELQKEQRSGQSKWTRFEIHGRIYDTTQWTHPVDNDQFNATGFSLLRGLNISAFFPRWDPGSGNVPSVCSTNTKPSKLTQASCISPEATALNMTGHCHNFTSITDRITFADSTFPVYRVASISFTADTVAAHIGTTTPPMLMIADGKVYDVAPMLYDAAPFTSTQKSFLQANVGKDISGRYSQYGVSIKCLDAIASVGVVDVRNTLACNISSYLLKTVTYTMVGIMAIKFLSALQLGSKRMPEDIDKYVFLQVPCYSEGEESLKKTIDSLSLTSYDDTRKLLFIVADGMVKGSGNEKPTPDLVLDILGVEEHQRNVASFSYHAIGEGSKGHNKAKIFSGLYHIQGRAVPYIVVIKCGTSTEMAKAGNRGKRDSQMILMKFANKIFMNLPMTPLELEMYRHIRNVIGIQPHLYEYILMVDADTEVGPDCLTRLVSSCINDARVMGLCGETQIANEKQSFITMIQVYEYYISHHLAKAFESLFGSVTCLPGCFCMYRIFSVSAGKKVPLLVAPQIIDDYSECVVDTLHKKNLLQLGEDRYLTTLMLKNFPGYKMKFTPDSHCLTIVPDKFSILLSQRRRWINSTIHNLFELTTLTDLCGCTIFSMRSVVMLDLFATLVMPASVVYLVYLIVEVTIAPSDHIQILYLIAATYGMQAVIFLIKRQWQHVGWMIIHILAMPVFYCYIPLYSFWHFDDFSWGATRRVEGDTGKGGHDGDNDKFDPSSIPTARWEEYKRVKRAEASLEVSKSAGYNAASDYAAARSPSMRLMHTPSTRAPSVYGARGLTHSVSSIQLENGMGERIQSTDALLNSAGMSNSASMSGRWQ